MASALVEIIRLADLNFVSIATTRPNNSVAAIAGKTWVTASAARREAGLAAEKIEVSGCVVPSGSRGGSCCAAAGGSCCPAAGGGCCPAAGGRPTLSRARLGPRRDLFSYGVPMRRITPGPAVPTGVRWVGEWVGGSPKDLLGCKIHGIPCHPYPVLAPCRAPHHRDAGLRAVVPPPGCVELPHARSLSSGSLRKQNARPGGSAIDCGSSGRKGTPPDYDRTPAGAT